MAVLTRPLLRAATLLGCTVVIALCHHYWRSDLYLLALPGALVLAVVHFLLFYFNASTPLHPGTPSSRRTTIVLAALVCVFFVLATIITVDGRGRGHLWINAEGQMESFLPEGLQPGTLLARLDVLETAIVFAVAILLQPWLTEFQSCRRQTNIRTGVSAIVMGYLFWITFKSWKDLYDTLDVPTLLPQMDTPFGVFVLLAMITTAVVLVAIADATCLMREPEEAFASCAYKYAIVMIAAALDLASTASVISFWWLVTGQTSLRAILCCLNKHPVEWTGAARKTKT